MNRETTTALVKSLITSLVPSTSIDPLLNSDLTNWAVRELRNDTQGSHRREWRDVHKALDGLVHSARVRVQDDLADALEGVKGDLEQKRKGVGREWDGVGGGDLTAGNLPQHVQFLLNLSNPPNSTTHDFAESYLTRQTQPYSGPTPDKVLYDEIMDPPFRGEHWGKGYDEEVHDGWSESDTEPSRSTASSSGEEQIWTPSSTRIAKMAKGIAHTREEEEQRLRDARGLLEDMAERAYWRLPSVEIGRVKDGVYGWKALSTEVSSLVLSETLSASPHTRLKLISASQLQREILFALTGRPNLLLTFYPTEPYCTIHPDHPYTLHYSKVALKSILSRLQANAANLTHLRVFVHEPTTFVSATRTAFVEALRSVLLDFAIWISDLETTLIQGVSNDNTPTPGSSVPVGTPLALLFALDTEYNDLIDLLVSSLVHADTPISLTDTLYTIYLSSRQSVSASTSHRLLRVFIATAEPSWASLGRWTTDGMPIPSALLDDESHAQDLDDERPFKGEGEFWLKRDKDVSWADEDFWECAWIVNEENGGWPVWLVSGHDDEKVGWKGRVVEAGKARGLLKGLARDISEKGSKEERWKTLDELIPSTDDESTNSKTETDESDIGSAIQAYLGPMCDLALFQLRQMLEVDCGLLAHLDAIEGTMYHQSFGVVAEWSEWLYSQVDSNKKSWADFQTLSSTYRETIRSQGETWMNAPAIRLSLLGRLKGAVGMEALGLVRIDYQVPFPLSQLFSPTSTELRSDVFTFLLQFGYARYLLHSVQSSAVRGQGIAGGGGRLPVEMRRILSLKYRFLWILDSIWMWMHDRVIAPFTAVYRQRLMETLSHGEMIQLELAHTRAIRKYCFLHDSTSIINGCIHQILHLTQALVDIFRTIEPDVILARNVESAPIPNMAQTSHVTGRSKRRRHKVQTRHRRRRTSFTDTSDSDSDSDPDAELEAEHGSGEAHNESDTIRPGVQSSEELLRAIDGRLSDIMQVFKDGVEELAFEESGGVILDDGGQRDTWGMLGFALEDWRGACLVGGL